MPDHNRDTLNSHALRESSRINEDNSIQSQYQPDGGPEEENHEQSENPGNILTYIDTPIPNIDADQDLVTIHLICCDDDVLTADLVETPCAWRFWSWSPKVSEIKDKGS